MAGISLRQAEAGDLPTLRALVRSYHAFEGVTCPGGDIDAAVSPLLGASDLGRIWLINASDATVGYVAICFGYSIEFGGRDAFIDEMYISDQHRGQGIGTEALKLVKNEMQAFGLNALHLEVSRDNERAQRLYRKIGFAPREKFFLMSARRN